MLKITAEEVNFLVHQYLEETGYKHTAFTFRHESSIDKSALNNAHIPPSMLLMYLEKALLMLQMETHLDKDDEVILCNQPFTLLSPHVCGYSPTTITRPHDDPAKRPFPVQIPMHTVAESLPKPTTQPLPAQGGVEPIQDKMQIDTPKVREDLSVPVKDPQKESGGRVFEEEKHIRVAPAKSVEQSVANIRGVKALEGHQGMVYNVAWHPNKRILASGGGDSAARLWQVDEVSEKNEGPLGESHPKKSMQLRVLPHISPESRQSQIDVTCLNWSAKKGMLVTGGSDGIARVWSESGDVVTQLKADEGIVFAAKWNNSGTRLLTVGSDSGKLSVWNTETWEESRVEGAHSGIIYDCDWKNDVEFVTCSADGLIKLWDLSLKEPKQVFRGHSGEVQQVKWDLAGTVLASCAEDNTAKIWVPLHGEKCLFDFTEHSGEILSLAWLPSGPGTPNPKPPLRLATASSDGTIKIWDIDKGKSLMTLKHPGGANTVAFSHNCEYLASGGENGTVQLYSLNDQKLVKSLTVSGKVCEVSWSFDNQIVAAACPFSVLLMDLRYL